LFLLNTLVPLSLSLSFLLLFWLHKGVNQILGTTRAVPSYIKCSKQSWKQLTRPVILCVRLIFDYKLLYIVCLSSCFSVSVCRCLRKGKKKRLLIY
ncbi:hypothetical protein F4703DRAFT_1920514, partial [Phycomyces blakesleeanus]